MNKKIQTSHVGSLPRSQKVVDFIFAREHGKEYDPDAFDAAMSEGVPAMMGLIQTLVGQGLWTSQREDNFLDTGAPWYRCYKTADEKFISVGAIEPQFFAELVRLLELGDELLKQQNDKSAWQAMHQLFEETFATKTRDEWSVIFEGTDACVAPVLTFEEARAYPHNLDRGTFVELNGITQTAVVPRMSAHSDAAPKPGSKTGADGNSVLLSAGFDEKEIDALASSGVLL